MINKGMEKITKENAIILKSYVDINLFDAYGSKACYNLFLKNGLCSSLRF
jgi:hypothetical protein